jgi:thymidine phosphorylase
MTDMTSAGTGDGGRFDGVGVIRVKRDGGQLSQRQIEDLMRAYLDGEFAEEQMAALLMAIVWRGMTSDELTTWTAAMIASGQRADLSGLGRPTVDKHSTGGVGDKLSLILVPLVAVFGAAVPQMSGRGLGHTGGTLDKLESIPGWRAELDQAEMFRVLDQVGGVITAAGAELDPADRRLYALRDITATVESIPLIASSIMSKKIAEGTGSLLLDVKVGSGAFMTDLGQARLLAQTMTQLGQAHGVRTAAMLTAMDTPLGRAVGNAIEVQEALDVLGGGGPDDVRDLSIAEAEAMLRLAGIDGNPAKALADGRALAKFHDMIRAQGGDLSQPLAQGRTLGTVTAWRDGVVRRLDARAAGMASWRLGAGRSRPGESVSAAAGVICLAKPGERVVTGQPMVELRGDDPTRLEAAKAELAGAIEIGDDPPPSAPLVLERIGL